jgi:hypothetical protein
MSISEEAVGGVVRTVQGIQVEAKVAHAARDMEGKVEVNVATRGTGEVVTVIGRVVRLPEEAVGPSASAMWAVGPPTSAMQAVRLPGGAIRLPGGVIEPLGGGQLDSLGWWSDHHPLQWGWSDRLRLRLDR